jgi:hypothetical protein
MNPIAAFVTRTQPAKQVATERTEPVLWRALSTLSGLAGP